MVNKSDEFLKQLLATFRLEADEHLQALSAGLFALEKSPAGGDAELVETIYREAHSLKGAARAVNLAEIETVCHALEGTFARLKAGQLALSPPLFDLLHQAIQLLQGLLMVGPDTPAPAAHAIAAVIRQLDAASNRAGRARAPRRTVATDSEASASVATDSQGPTTSTQAALSTSLGSQTVRISTEKLDAVMRQVEELVSPRLAAGQRAADLREAAGMLSAWTKERARLQPALRVVERSSRQSPAIAGNPQTAKEFAAMLEYLEAESFHLAAIENRLENLSQSAERDQRTLAAMTDRLLHEVKEMHLLPFASLLELFPRIIRELARDQGKEIALVVTGSEIEVDRRILETLKDPLIHVIRNCIDHGIENPERRREKHKPAHGTITISISQKDSGKVQILVTDDGSGIDPARVKSAAHKLGVVSARDMEKLDDEQALALAFCSGVSTSAVITELSGRGLGLAIVQERVERLGGVITLESNHDAGTSLRIVLPLTLATYRGVWVRAGDAVMVIPVMAIERVIRVSRKDIRTVENHETVSLDGQTVSLVWLSDVLELPRKSVATESTDKVQAVVLSVGDVRVAFRVEEILGEKEILVKTLGPQLVRVRNIAGACVFGAGVLVPVLNVGDLMKSAMKPRGAPIASRAPEANAALLQPSILVVEDSITARALLKSILESAGYEVTTAVDGIDAYTTLKSETFDLVVSDVEMPRMDGFDLTAKIRADKALAELPVILVTALASREHRERGVDVGASAYIVKSSFDQSNLLEVIKRLI